jgi:hypothetical protein
MAGLSLMKKREKPPIPARAWRNAKKKLTTRSSAGERRCEGGETAPSSLTLRQQAGDATLLEGRRGL